MEKRTKSRRTGVAVIIVLAVIAMGQGPCEIKGCSISFPPLRYIALFTNTEDKIMTVSTSPVFTLLGGYRMIGAVPHGTVPLNIYSNLGAPDSNLQVLCPGNSYGACAGEPAHYLNLRDSPSQAAAAIRDYYIEYSPIISSYQRQNWNVAFLDANTQYPVFSAGLFPTYNGGTGSIHRIRIMAFPGDFIQEDRYSLQIVDAGGNAVAWMDRGGREHYIRQGEVAHWTPSIISASPMSDSAVNPPVVPLGFQPTVTVDQQLGLAGVRLYWVETGNPSPYPDLPYYFSNGPISARISAETRNADNTWTYTFVPDEALLPETDYVFMVEVAIKDDPAGYNGIPPAKFQAGTQNRHGNLIIYNGPTPPLPECEDYSPTLDPLTISGGCDAGFLTSGTANSVVVIPFFFHTDPGNLTMPVLNPGELPLIPASVVIKPEALRPNDGVFTAIVSLPESYDVGAITSCYANGAAATGMNIDTEGKFLVCHFERQHITYDMGTLFVVYGQTSDGYYFAGMDRIQRIIK